MRRFSHFLFFLHFSFYIKHKSLAMCLTITLAKVKEVHVNLSDQSWVCHLDCLGCLFQYLKVPSKSLRLKKKGRYQFECKSLSVGHLDCKGCLFQYGCKSSIKIYPPNKEMKVSIFKMIHRSLHPVQFVF